MQQFVETIKIKDGKALSGTFIGNIENGFFAEETEKVGEDRYQYCTAIPVGTLLAQSWNLPMVEEIGEMIGKEMLEFARTGILTDHFFAIRAFTPAERKGILQNIPQYIYPPLFWLCQYPDLS